PALAPGGGGGVPEARGAPRPARPRRGAAPLPPAGGGEGPLVVPLGRSRRSPPHPRGARSRGAAPVAAHPRRTRRRGPHRGVLRGRRRWHRHALRRRRGAARLPAPAPPRGARLLFRIV